MVVVPKVVRLVHGQVSAELLIVIGDEPMTVNEVQESEPEQLTDVVATLASPLVPLPYRSCEAVRVDWPVPPVPIGSTPVR